MKFTTKTIFLIYTDAGKEFHLRFCFKYSTKFCDIGLNDSTIWYASTLFEILVFADYWTNIALKLSVEMQIREMQVFSTMFNIIANIFQS